MKSIEVCPKCGTSGAWDGPRYRSYDWAGKERLEYTCSTCRYVRVVPTKDAKSDA